MADDTIAQSWGTPMTSSNRTNSTDTTVADTNTDDDFDFGKPADDLSGFKVADPIKESSDTFSNQTVSEKETDDFAAAPNVNMTEGLDQVESKLRAVKDSLNEEIEDLNDKLAKADEMLSRITKVRDEEKSLASEIEKVLSE